MFKKFVACIWLVLTPLSAAFAQDYKIASPRPIEHPAGRAVSSFTQLLAAEQTDAKLESIHGIGSPREFLKFLENGIVDFAVVPFEAVPSLANSPLLKPFYAENATELRQAIDSEVGAFEKTKIETDGFRVLDFWLVSSTVFASKTPVRSTLDLQGLKVVDFGNTETLVQLGAAPTQMAFAEVLTALERGAIDSSAVPYDERSIALGFNKVVNNYVDRQYRPQLYAVLVHEDRWDKIPFPDQHYLAKAAAQVGQDLVATVDASAQRFKSDELARGSNFTSWNSEDVQRVQLASLATLNPDDRIARQLVSLTFASARAQPAPSPQSEPRPEQPISLFFATDRIKADLSNPEIAFSAQSRLNGHSFGTADLKLKKGRKFGDKLEKVIKIEQIDLTSSQQFFNAIKTDGKNVLVFVHGYNNGYADSIRRGATIQADIVPNATVISYTWPSDGELLSYGYDEASTDTALQNFKSFMDKLTSTVDPQKINLIAHSMGSRLLTKYVAGLAERGQLPDKVKFNNIIYAAADVSRRFFKQQQEAPPNPNYPLSAYANALTIYSSKHDGPLGLSDKLHKEPPLGLSDPSNIYLASDVVSVDASKIDPAKLFVPFPLVTRHSYVFDKEAGVRDLSMLLTGVSPDTRPGMTERSRDAHRYWELAP